MSDIVAVLVVLLTCLAGGAGAALRWWSDTRVQRAVEGRYPWGTIVVNVVGSFLLGALVALAGDVAGGTLLQVLGFGLLGGYTTFSSSVVQSVRAAASDGLFQGVLHAMCTVMLCLFAALCGLQVG